MMERYDLGPDNYDEQGRSEQMIGDTGPQDSDPPDPPPSETK